MLTLFEAVPTGWGFSSFYFIWSHSLVGHTLSLFFFLFLSPHFRASTFMHRLVGFHYRFLIFLFYSFFFFSILVLHVRFLGFTFSWLMTELGVWVLRCPNIVALYVNRTSLVIFCLGFYVDFVFSDLLMMPVCFCEIKGFVVWVGFHWSVYCLISLLGFVGGADKSEGFWL